MANRTPRTTLIDMTGKRSGRLTVIERGPNKADGTAQWYCKCDCGSPKITLLTGKNLRTNITKSCGCLWKEHIDWMIENRGQLLAEYRNRGTPQATCHPERPHEAKGLCAECYYQVKRHYNPERDKETSRARRRREGKSTAENSPVRRRQLKYLYNIKPEDYAAMFREQGGVCACCGLPETKKYRNTGLVLRLQVDHDHGCCDGKRSCGKCVRGLICWQCNTILGLAKDNPRLFDSMASYLRAGGHAGMKRIKEYVEECTVENLGL